MLLRPNDFILLHLHMVPMQVLIRLLGVIRVELGKVVPSLEESICCPPAKKVKRVFLIQLEGQADQPGTLICLHDN